MIWKAKRDPLDPWRPWFAWHPVYIDGWKFWLTWVERERFLACPYFWGFRYRHKR